MALSGTIEDVTHYNINLYVQKEKHSLEMYDNLMRIKQLNVIILVTFVSMEE